MIRFFLLPAAALWCALQAHALATTALPPLLAEYTHTAWDATRGAPSGIMRIVQGADGWLWIATDNGLYRYDGDQFERVDAIDGHRLGSSDVVGLMSGRDGALWVGYRQGGLSVFRHGGSRTFTPRAGLAAGTIRDIEEAPDGSVWVAMPEGVFRLAAGAARFERQGAAAGLPGQGIFRILFARDGRQWIATAQGLLVRGPGQARFAPAWPRGEVLDLVEAPDGAILAQSGRGGAPGAFYRAGVLPPSDGAGAAIAAYAAGVDRDGQLWLFQSDAVERRASVDAPAATGQTLTHAGGLSGAYPQAFCQDREGNIWIGTAAGIDRFRRNRLQAVAPQNALIYPALARAPDGGIVIGNYDGGLYRIGAGGDARRVSNARFTASHLAPDGTLWLADDQTLKRWDAHGGAGSVALPAAQRGHEVQAMQMDPSGTLWVWISGGQGLFRLTRGRWDGPDDRPGLAANSVLTMALDHQGAVWMGRQDNLVSIVAGDGAPHPAVRRLDAAQGLQVGDVLALLADGESMWIGGERGAMLYRQGRLLALRGSQGEAFAGVSGMVRLPDGSLWLHGLRGVYRIGAASLAQWMRDPARAVEFERFDALDGLRGHALQMRPLPSLARSADGKLWFSTGSAVAFIDPAHVARNRMPPPVAIRHVAVNDTLYEVGQRTALRLPEGSDRMRFAFTALSLSMPERVRFRYRLAGMDAGWQDAAGRSAVSYTNLAPGDYRFEVVAANEDGVWSRQPAALDLHVPPRFVQTRWFTLLLALAALLAAYGLYAARVRYLGRRMRERHQVQLDERMRIARTLHDNLLQSVQGVLLSFGAHARHLPDGSPARAQVERTLAHGQRVVREGRDQIMGLRASVLARDPGQALQPYGDELAAAGGHAFAVRVLGNTRTLNDTVCEELVAIAREALFNASRHAQARHVVLELDYRAGRFALCVRDDGRGLAPDVAAAGCRADHWGLPGMRERAARIGALFHLASQPGQGTEVTVTLAGALAYPKAGSSMLRMLLRRPGWPGRRTRGRSNLPR